MTAMEIYINTYELLDYTVAHSVLCAFFSSFTSFVRSFWGGAVVDAGVDIVVQAVLVLYRRACHTLPIPTSLHTLSNTHDKVCV